MSRTEICLIALAAAVSLWFLKKAPKSHTFAAFIAVAGLAGGAVGGWLPRILLWVTHWLTLGEDKVTTLAFGGIDPGILPSVLAGTAIGFVIHDLWPKHAAKRHTVIIAAAAPILMLAAGGQWAAAVHGNLALAGASASSITTTSSIGG